MARSLPQAPIFASGFGIHLVNSLVLAFLALGTSVSIDESNQI